MADGGDFGGGDFGPGDPGAGFGPDTGDTGYGADTSGSNYGFDWGSMSPSDYGGYGLGNGGFGSGDLGDFGLGDIGNYSAPDYYDEAAPTQTIEVMGRRNRDNTPSAGANRGEPQPNSPTYNVLNHPFTKALTTVLSAISPHFGMLNFGMRMANPDVNDFENEAQGRAFGGRFGSALGGMFGPAGAAVGGLAGGLAGKGAGGTTAPEGATGANPGGLAGGGSGMLDSMANLGGLLYGSNQFNKGTNQQISDLQSMYGPNSAYAQVMRKNLEARDAAAGRRSQYGPREVELQAALANANSRNAPTLANLNQQQQAQRWKQQQALMYLYQQMGGAKGIGRGLEGLFGGGGSGISMPGDTPYDPGFSLGQGGFGSEPPDLGPDVGNSWGW